MQVTPQLTRFAALHNKTVSQLCEAIADAQLCEFARIAEFNVNARHMGSFIQFKYRHTTREVKPTPENIFQYFIQLTNNQ